MGNSNSFEQTRTRKIRERDNSLKEHLKMIDGKLSELHVDDRFAEKIINSSCVELVDMINKGTASSQQITAAYARRAGTAGHKLKSITQDNFVEAMKIAAQLDDHRKISGMRNWTFGDPWDMDKFLPPLFGVPISVKDTIDMNGFASTIGLTARTDRITTDGVIMHGIRNSGQVPFVRTNIPQLAMTYESNNFLWGRSVNPWNVDRASGGSSGGQAALIALRGSPIGVGSDIGGSLRIPADFCGITALKSGSGRLSFSGHTPFVDSMDGNPIVPGVLGPMARAVDDLALWMKALTTKEMYKGNHDPYTSYPFFDDKKYVEAQKTIYKIGYIRNFQMMETSAASQRAVKEATDALREAGHQLTEIKIPNEKEIIASFIQFMTGQGDMKSYRKLLEGQPFVEQYSNNSVLTKLNAKCYCCFYCLNGIMNKTQPRVGFIMEQISQLSTHDYLMNAGAIKRQKKEWAEYLKKEKIDFVVAPGFGCQAMINGLSNEINIPASYTFMWNLLDVPAGSVPVTLTRNDEQNYESRTQDDFTKVLRKNAWGSEGLPAGVQVIGVPFDEERVLGVMKVIEQRVKFNQRFGAPKTV